MASAVLKKLPPYIPLDEPDLPATLPPPPDAPPESTGSAPPQAPLEGQAQPDLPLPVSPPQGLPPGPAPMPREEASLPPPAPAPAPKREEPEFYHQNNPVKLPPYIDTTSTGNPELQPSSAAPNKEPPSPRGELSATVGGLALSNLPIAGPPVPGNPVRGGLAFLGGFGGYLAGSTSEILQSDDWSLKRFETALKNSVKTGVIQMGLETTAPIVGQAGKYVVQRGMKPFQFFGRTISPQSQRVVTAPGMEQQVLDPAVKEAEQRLAQQGNKGGLLLSQRTADPAEKSIASKLEGVAGSSSEVTAARSKISHDLNKSLFDEAQALKNTNMRPMEQAYDMIRSRTGHQNIIEVGDILRTIMDPRNAEGQKLVNLIRAKYQTDPKAYGEVWGALERTGALPGPGHGLGYQDIKVNFDVAMRLKDLFQDIGWQMRKSGTPGAEATIEGAKQLAKAFDARISDGLRNFLSVARGPGNRPLHTIYEQAKAVGHRLYDKRRLGDLILDSAETLPQGDIHLLTSKSLISQANKFGINELEQWVGKDGVKTLENFRTILQIAERKQDETGRILIAMKWGAAGLGVLGAAGQIGLSAVGYDTNVGYQTMLGSVAILLTPKILGKLLTHPTLLQHFKTEVVEATRPGTKAGQAVQRINTWLGQMAESGPAKIGARIGRQAAGATGAEMFANDPINKGGPEFDKDTGALRNPALDLPNPVPAAPPGELPSEREPEPEPVPSKTAIPPAPTQEPSSTELPPIAAQADRYKERFPQEAGPKVGPQAGTPHPAPEPSAPVEKPEETFPPGEGPKVNELPRYTMRGGVTKRVEDAGQHLLDWLKGTPSLPLPAGPNEAAASKPPPEKLPDISEITGEVGKAPVAPRSVRKIITERDYAEINRAHDAWLNDEISERRLEVEVAKVLTRAARAGGKTLQGKQLNTAVEEYMTLLRQTKKSKHPVTTP